MGVKHTHSYIYYSPPGTPIIADGYLDLADPADFLYKEPTGWRKPSSKNHIDATSELVSTRFKLKTPWYYTLEVAAGTHSEGTTTYSISDSIISQYTDSGLLSFQEKCTTEFRAKIQSEIEAFQGLVFIAEAGKTTRMFRNLVTRLSHLRDLALHYKKLSTHNPNSRAVYQLLLELNYGWKPFIADLRRLEKQVKKLARKKQYFFIPFSKTDFEVNTYTTNFFTPLAYIRREKISTNRQAKGLACYLLKVPNGTLRSFGLRPSSVLPALWELTPYSFVVDYVSNIGDMIKSFALCEGELLYAWMGTYSSVSAFTSAEDYPPYKVYKGYKVSSNLKEEETVQKNRFDIKASTPNIRLALTLPTGAQYLNLAALLSSKRR